MRSCLYHWKMLRNSGDDVARPTLRLVGRERTAKSAMPVPFCPAAKREVGHFSCGAYGAGMTKPSTTAVLYNSQCPVCSAEIGHYARYAEDAGLPIRFDDLSADACDRWGLDHDAAARRLYVQRDGVVTSGVPAFLLLWAQMPRYRLLARLLGLPVVRHIASAAYDHVFAPALYRAHLRRLRSQGRS